jgi:tetratricopeptide (TPR) repeat protein
MGYCLFENGNYEEAKACFEKIIQRVRTDSALAAETKELY